MEIAEKYEVSKTTIAFSRILRHPAKTQPVTGTINLTRLVDCIKASEITLARKEWYEIYKVQATPAVTKTINTGTHDFKKVCEALIL